MKTILLLVLTILVGCKNQSNTSYRIGTDTIFGKWSVISTDSLDMYYELEFNEDSKYVEIEYSFESSRSNYIIEKDSIFLLATSYKIDPISQDLIVLVNDLDTLLLHRHRFNYVVKSFDQHNPFWFRRCYYLLHYDEITMNEAVEYLMKLIKPIPDSLMPIEEVIFINEI